MTSSESDDVLLQLRNEHMTWREIDGEVIVLDLRSSSYFALNPTAARLWRALADGTTRAQLVQDVMDSFGVDTEQAEHDVNTFLDSCRASDFLQ